MAGVVASVATGSILALFSIKYLVDQVVLGVVLNLFASGLTGFIFDQLVQPNSGHLNSAPIMQADPDPAAVDIPLLGPILFNQTILVYLAALSVAAGVVPAVPHPVGPAGAGGGRAPEGRRHGRHLRRAVRWQAVLLGGVFAGLGGAFFTIGSTGAFNKDITVGNGFIALAALIMGRWHPVRAALMAVFFGFVTQLATQLQSLSTPMPSQFLLMLPYIATIIAVAGLIGRTRGPAADGVPVRQVTGTRGHRLGRPARAARACVRAYAPYSGYPVGAAALVSDGRVVVGCNVENAGYGVTLCAECGLVSDLVRGGGGRLVAFTCCNGEGDVIMPCGRCRQLLWEHGGAPMLARGHPQGILTMADVLPQAFGADDLAAGA